MATTGARFAFEEMEVLNFIFNNIAQQYWSGSVKPVRKFFPIVDGKLDDAHALVAEFNASSATFQSGRPSWMPSRTQWSLADADEPLCWGVSSATTPTFGATFSIAFTAGESIAANDELIDFGAGNPLGHDRSPTAASTGCDIVGLLVCVPTWLDSDSMCPLLVLELDDPVTIPSGGGTAPQIAVGDLQVRAT